MKKILIIIIVFLKYTPTMSQLYQDAGGIAMTTHSKAKLKNLPDNSPLKNRELSLQTYDVWMPLPYFKIGQMDFFTTLNYKLINIDYLDRTSIDVNRPEQIHEIKSVIFAKYSLQKKWSVLAFALPSLASDFKESISKDDFILQGGVALTKKINVESEFEIGFGVFVTYVFGDLQLIPAFTIDYKSDNGKWLGQAYWPKFSLFYNINENSQVGIAASVDGTDYNLKNYTNMQDYSVGNADFSILYTGLQFNKRVVDKIWFQLQGGIAMNNKYKLFDNTNREIPDADYSLNDMMYAKVMLTYRFEFD